MGLLAAALRAQGSGTRGPADDFWYSDPWESPLDSPIAVTAESVFRCGTVLAAVRFLADAWAMCPPRIVRVLPGNRREDVHGHPAQRLLRQPNVWQTGFTWRHVNMTWCATWGNSYNRIVGGADSFAQELRPLHPSRVTVVRQLEDGSLVYAYRKPDGVAETLRQDQVLHFRGISFDGLSGAPIYKLIRNAVTIALLAERHTSTFLRKGQRLAGLLVPSMPLQEEQRRDLRNAWNEAYGGPENTGTVATLPFGIDFKVVSMDNQKAQLVELSDRQVGEILRMLGVPGVVVGWMGDKTATYASAESFFEKGGIKHCVLPWLMNFEAQEEQTLLIHSDERVKHNLDVLLRANTKDRYEALFKATGRPWLTGNEARRTEDLNPIEDDPSMDRVAQPPNTAGDAGDQAMEPAPPERAADRKRTPAKPQEDDQESASSRRLLAFVTSAAERVVRREIAAVVGQEGRGPNGGRAPALRFASDVQGWQTWLTGFYARHAEYVAEVMCVSGTAARAYADAQRRELIELGIGAVESWATTAVPHLVGLALEGTCTNE